jgi:hypothetical protein
MERMARFNPGDHHKVEPATSTAVTGFGGCFSVALDMSHRR